MAKFNRSEMFKIAHKRVKEYFNENPQSAYTYRYLLSNALKQGYRAMVSQYQKELAQEKAAPEVAKLGALIGDAEGRKRSNIARKYVESYISERGLSRFVNRYQVVSLAKYCEQSKEIRIYIGRNDINEFKGVRNDLQVILRNFDFDLDVY